MEPQRPEHPEPELDALLRRSRPEPDGHWVRATGEQLFPPARTRTWVPALRLGTSLAVALAATATVFSLAGVGPLGDADQTVQAKDDCRTITVTRVERVPAIVTGTDGKLSVTYERKPVRSTQQRCR